VLPDFRLETLFSRWEFSARYNLAASDMETVALGELLALADTEDREAWETLRLGYIPSRGIPQLREAIASWYEVITGENVICFTGAQEGIFCAMHALLSPGDHAVVLVPNYQSTETIPASICEVSGVALRPAEGWRLDLDELRNALRPNTRVIAINFPNNPTGALTDPGSFGAIIRLAEERGIYLLSDEVYRGVERDPAARLPHAADLSERTLSLGVTSKALGLPGLRVGWIATRDRALMDRLERMKHYLSIAGAGPSEVLATIALKHRARILARNTALLDENRTLLREFFMRHEDVLEWYDPGGGCVQFPRYCGSEGAEELCRRAVERHGVLMLPPSVFASKLATVPGDRIRLGYGRRDLGSALAAFERVLTE